MYRPPGMHRWTGYTAVLEGGDRFWPLHRLAEVIIIIESLLGPRGDLPPDVGALGVTGREFEGCPGLDLDAGGCVEDVRRPRAGATASGCMNDSVATGAPYVASARLWENWQASPWAGRLKCNGG